MRTIVHMAIGLAALVAVAPACLAQDSAVLDRCKSAGTASEAEEPRAHQEPGSKSGISLAVPIGRVCIDPELVDGQPSYVRRTTGKEGMAIVEVSTTPFVPVMAGEVAQYIPRPDQPASW
jgi:hypothetical protein